MLVCSDTPHKSRCHRKIWYAKQYRDHNKLCRRGIVWISYSNASDQIISFERPGKKSKI